MTGEGDKTDFNEQNSSQPWPRWLLSFEQVIEAADGVLNLAEVLTCIGNMRLQMSLRGHCDAASSRPLDIPAGPPRNYPGTMSMAARGERPAAKW
jgi:hypothetical protein